MSPKAESTSMARARNELQNVLKQQETEGISNVPSPAEATPIIAVPEQLHLAGAPRTPRAPHAHLNANSHNHDLEQFQVLYRENMRMHHLFDVHPEDFCEICAHNSRWDSWIRCAKVLSWVLGVIGVVFLIGYTSWLMVERIKAQKPKEY